MERRRRQCNNKASRSEPEEEAFEFPSLSASSDPPMISCDIISGGKLLPFCAPTDDLQQQYPPPPPAEIIGKSSQVNADYSRLLVGVGSSSRVSQRLAGDTYRKLRKDQEEEEDANLPVSLMGRKKPARSRWYVLAFGFRSAAAAMELKEIRRRITRHQHKSLESMAAEELVKKKKKKKEWGPWKLLLRSLTCMYM